MFGELVGKYINNVFLLEGGTILIFDTDEGEYYYTAVPECCNDCWVEHTDPFAQIIDTVVMKVQTTSYDHIPPQEEYGNTLDKSFITFTTDKGHWGLEFRNSNDHWEYGGSMELTKINGVDHAY